MMFSRLIISFFRFPLGFKDAVGADYLKAISIFVAEKKSMKRILLPEFESRGCEEANLCHGN